MSHVPLLQNLSYFLERNSVSAFGLLITCDENVSDNDVRTIQRTISQKLAEFGIEPSITKEQEGYILTGQIGNHEITDIMDVMVEAVLSLPKHLRNRIITET